MYIISDISNTLLPLILPAVAAVAIGVLLVAAVVLAVARHTRASRTSIVSIDTQGQLFTKADRRRMLKGQGLGGSSTSTATNSSEWSGGSTGTMSVDDMVWDDNSSAGGSVFFISPGRLEPGRVDNIDAQSASSFGISDELEDDAPAQPTFI